MTNSLTNSLTNSSAQTSELHLVAKSPREKATKASFAGCPISDRKIFHLSKCIVPISLGGSKEHEGNKFAATVKLINSHFKSCSLLIVDSIYRYTLKINYPHETDTMLLQRSIDAGDQWLERNEAACKLLTIPHRIIRWNEYLKHKNFNKHYKIVSELYKKDASYKKALDDSTEEYLTRHFHANPEPRFISYEDAFQCCINYLKEECACVCVFGGDSFEEYEFQVYPTMLTTALTANYERFIKPNYPNLLRPVALRFHKK